MLRALQKLFNLETLVGENLVSWPPIYLNGVTPGTLQDGVGVGRGSDRKTRRPPPFEGCTTLERAGPGPTLLLENELSWPELEAVLSQVGSGELVLVWNWEVMGEAVSRHHVGGALRSSEQGERRGWEETGMVPPP